jgi:hypothetical protein
MSSLMMVLVCQNMKERLTRHHNKVVTLMHLLVFYEDIYRNARSNQQDQSYICAVAITIP